MENKELILSELAYDYGMNERQVENFIYLLLAKNDIFRSWLRIELEHESKGDR
jgi:hypothetical protein